MKTLIIAAALAALAAPATAQDRNLSGETATVAVSDLDLSSPAGADAMLGRINAAARKVCREYPSGEIGFQRRYKNCIARSTERALERLASPFVTARYRKASVAVLASR